MLQNKFESTVSGVSSEVSSMSQVDNRAWPQTLVEMVDVLEYLFERKHRQDKDAAQQNARECVVTLAQHFGGRAVYMPVGRRLEKAMRDRAIWDEFTGNNIPALVDKYQLSHQQIRNIIAKQRSVRSS